MNEKNFEIRFVNESLGAKNFLRGKEKKKREKRSDVTCCSSPTQISTGRDEVRIHVKLSSIGTERRLVDPPPPPRFY